MLQIVKSIFTSPAWPHLALKGGTACYFLYGLDRFSTDLDFDIIHPEAKIDTILQEVVKKYGELTAGQRLVLSYGKNETNIKIDVNRKIWKANTYEMLSFFWAPIRIQTKDTIFANKLVALLERMANRDMYDVHFFFQQLFQVNEAVVEERTGKSLKEVLKLILEHLQRLPKEYKILDGLGEVLDEKQKFWVKTHLVDTLRGMLAMMVKF